MGMTLATFIITMCFEAPNRLANSEIYGQDADARSLALLTPVKRCQNVSGISSVIMHTNAHNYNKQWANTLRNPVLIQNLLFTVA
jgi:hypothetical protein